MNEWMNKLMNDQLMVKEMEMISESFYSNHCYRLTLELSQYPSVFIFFKDWRKFRPEVKMDLSPEFEINLAQLSRQDEAKT